MDEGFVGDDSTSSISYSTSSSSTSSSRDLYLKHVNRNSHQISKPIRKPLPLPTTASSSTIPILEPSPGQAQPQSQQPPVYNINKNDFRDVVQKLTGSPAHERFPGPPPPVTQSRSPSSRLQRIRPPPLVQISNRPPQLTHVVPRPQNDGGQRAAVAQPFTPLPPLPSVHPAAESPISAYMRFLQSSASAPAPSPLWNGVAPIGPRPDSLLSQNDVDQCGAQPQPLSLLPPTESPVSAYMRFLQSSYSSSTASPRWNGVALPQQPPLLPPQQQQQPPLPSSAASPSPFPVLPLSPLPFGCIPSPRSPYGTLFSPTGQLGLPQLPLSPTLPVPSSRWKGM
ncbi:hypothetical protein Pfo_021800 [Paulownia fortunei]|nr:hypothetical protein Pfo_021800 [Paulownia fortunei]